MLDKDKINLEDSLITEKIEYLKIHHYHLKENLIKKSTNSNRNETINQIENEVKILINYSYY